MKRLLLTGATGFIGRHCLPLLVRKGFEVHAVCSKSAGEKLQNICWHQADLLDQVQVARLMGKVQPSHLLHFAWITVPREYWTSLENIRWVQASLQLVQAFAECGGQRVVVAGTCAEYDWRYGYCSEQITPLLPVTLYGSCKHSLQVVINAFAKQINLSAAWGRIFYLYGPHEYPNRLVASVIRSILQGSPALCSHGKQIRDLLYVEDVAEAFVALLDSEAVGPVNIASGCPVSLKDVIYRIARKLHREDLIQLGALPPSANEPPLIAADVDRLNKEVGWSPRYDLDAGLEQTIRWWESQSLKLTNQSH